MKVFVFPSYHTLSDKWEGLVTTRTKDRQLDINKIKPNIRKSECSNSATQYEQQNCFLYKRMAYE